MCGVGCSRRITSVLLARDTGIALLGGRYEDAIAAHRNAGRTRKRAFVTLLEFAASVATRVRAAFVVALFAHLNDAVAARRSLANASLTGRARARSVHGEAIFGTPRATLERALIALLTLVCLHDPIATVWKFGARARLAAPTGFCLAPLGTVGSSRATIAWVRWIACFTRLDSAISAFERGDALLPGNTLVSWLLGFAIRGTAGAALECALIANLARVHDAIAALERDDTRKAMR